MKPCSSWSRSKTRLAVCRCLRGRRASSPNHRSMMCSNPVNTDAPALANEVGGAGEKSCCPAYLATEVRLTPSLRAISRAGTPRESNFLIFSCNDMGTVICFPALPAHTLCNGSAVRNLSVGGGPMSLTHWARPRTTGDLYRQASPETLIPRRYDWPNSYRSFGLKWATNLAHILG